MAKRIYNQTSLFGPLYAYLVVLSPPENIKRQNCCYKRDLNNINSITDRNLQSIAHITLVDKLTDDVNFPKTIEELIRKEKSFTVKIKGWDFFDHGHSITIYLKVENPLPIQHLMELVKSPSRSPHISLAKNISHQTFDMLKPYLNNLDYSAEWLCSEVNVLCKLMSEKHLGFKEKIVIPLST